MVALVAAAVRSRVWPWQVRQALAGASGRATGPCCWRCSGRWRTGVESALELRYRGVERRHRLPRATLQVRKRLDDGLVRSDVRYPEQGVTVELDGGFAHPLGRTDADTWRDNAVLLARGDLTLRYRWAHVVRRPCDVARQVGEALRSRGWRGLPRPCGPGCPAAG